MNDITLLTVERLARLLYAANARARQGEHFWVPSPRPWDTLSRRTKCHWRTVASDVLGDWGGGTG